MFYFWGYSVDPYSGTEGVGSINNETEINGSSPICSSKSYVNALNTMHSLWSVTQTGYCAVPGLEERRGRGPL